jgi:hypothetical protein
VSEELKKKKKKKPCLVPSSGNGEKWIGLQQFDTH